MRVREQHVQSCGTGQCRTEPPPSESSTTAGGPSVQIVDESKTGWIGIELVDTEGRHVPGADYEVELPDGHVVTGKLDALGKVRIEGIEPGQCAVIFPKLDRRDFD